jgi:hypothetical protein
MAILHLNQSTEQQRMPTLDNFIKYFDDLCFVQFPEIFKLHTYFRCPDDAIRTPTATINIHNMLMSNAYVLLDDFRYSPKRSMPQKVLTSGSA